MRKVRPHPQFPGFSDSLEAQTVEAQTLTALPSFASTCLLLDKMLLAFDLVDEVMQAGHGEERRLYVGFDLKVSLLTEG